MRLSLVALSHRTEGVGRRIPTLGLSRIEEGERRVDADDLAALSRALETDVLTLLGQEPPPAHKEAILVCEEFLIRVQVTRGAITDAIKLPAS